MSNPTISVVLGSYNRLLFLPLTIQSIRQELAQIAHEIIVIDGGSNDGSLEWLTQQKDIVTIVQHNRGEWAGKKIERRSWGYFMNLGFKCAQGKYVCMLSDDCLVIPGAIKNGIALFERELASMRNLGALAFYWRDWSREETYHVGYTHSDKLYVNHGMFLNTALKAVGYIDEESFFFYNADGDLCLKLWHQGYEVITSPDSYIEHYPHANPDVRKTNYACFKQDLKNYLAKWEGIFYDPQKNNLGHIEEKVFHDAFNTGGIFAEQHQTVIKEHPKLTRKKNIFEKRLAQAIHMRNAAVRKLKNLWS